MSDISANTNYQMYATIADDAARKYNIAPGIFKSLIMSESSFDPNAYNASGASGIAQFMPTTAASMKIDPFNPIDSLDAAAKYLSTNFKKYGNYADAISQYKGYSNLADGYSAANKVIDDASSIFGGSLSDNIPLSNAADNYTPLTDAQKAASKSPTGSIFTWSIGDWKSFLSSSAYGFVIGLVGILLIVGTIWALINKSAPTIIKGAIK